VLLEEPVPMEDQVPKVKQVSTVQMVYLGDQEQQAFLVRLVNQALRALMVFLAHPVKEFKVVQETMVIEVPQVKKVTVEYPA